MSRSAMACALISALGLWGCTGEDALGLGVHEQAARTAVYPKSTAITGLRFDMSTVRQEAPGSDNWAITWCDDGHQYTTWGDGGGFGGTGSDGRVSFGVARVEGSKTSYQGFNVNGGKNAEAGHTLPDGKSLGILCVDLSAHGGKKGTLYLFRNGTGSGGGAFAQTELYKSTDHGRTFSLTSARWTFGTSGGGFYSPSFLQFGKDYAGARDGYVYIYLNENQGDGWEVQTPGRISLARVRKESLDDKSAYQFFAGLSNGNPTWSNDINARKPVFEDAINGTMRTSVSYNAPLKRYLLTTQQVSRWADQDGHIGIYEAPQPWGPWSTVLFGNAWSAGPQTSGAKTVFWNFSNKWLSSDGKRFTMVYTGPGADNWGTVQGDFLAGATPPPPPPPADSGTPPPADSGAPPPADAGIPSTPDSATPPSGSPPLLGKDGVIEGQAMLLSGYAVDLEAGNGEWVRLQGVTSGTARALFNGSDGRYDVQAVVVHEQDGAPRIQLAIDGVEVGSYTYGIESVSRTVKTITLARDVFIESAQEMTITGVREGGAHARFDELRLLPAGSPPPAQPDAGAEPQPDTRVDSSQKLPVVFPDAGPVDDSSATSSKAPCNSNADCPDDEFCMPEAVSCPRGEACSYSGVCLQKRPVTVRIEGCAVGADAEGGLWVMVLLLGFALTRRQKGRSVE